MVIIQAKKFKNGGSNMNELVNTKAMDTVKIADEVVATIAGITALEVENITLNAGGGLLSKKTSAKGVKVESKEDGLHLYMNATVKYGCKIHIVAQTLQQRVRKAVEDMTGLNVVSVNVNVTNIIEEELPAETHKENNDE
jgi:uncharacterized alkaline shock family protein YloU